MVAVAAGDVSPHAVQGQPTAVAKLLLLRNSELEKVIAVPQV